MDGIADIVEEIRALETQGLMWFFFTHRVDRWSTNPRVELETPQNSLIACSLGFRVGGNLVCHACSPSSGFLGSRPGA